jgi:hypothetical protein
MKTISILIVRADPWAMPRHYEHCPTPKQAIPRSSDETGSVE